MNTAAQVAQTKENHPERFCPKPRCLWRTGGGYCPRHIAPAVVAPILRSLSEAAEEETEHVHDHKRVSKSDRTDRLRFVNTIYRCACGDQIDF